MQYSFKIGSCASLSSPWIEDCRARTSRVRMNDKLPSRVKPRDFHWFLLFVKLTRVQRTRPQPFVSLMEF